jgi:hypothetical protein
MIESTFAGNEGAVSNPSVHDRAATIFGSWV